MKRFDLPTLLAATAIAIAFAAPAAAQGEHDHHGGHATPTPTPTPAPAQPDHAAHGAHAAMAMDPLMARARAMGSGTSWNPAVSPMRMWSWKTGDWLWMAHGDLVGGYNHQAGPRGASTWAAENWQMVMGSRYWGPGILDLRAMTSLEPFTLPAGGTPQLLQTGESWQGKPLLDKQHPHDLLMELSGRYTWNLADATNVFLYGGLAGEPALGPAAFMHRPSAADNHWAPLGHHLQDSSHISYGVVTTGVRVGDVQLEASAFNGREPDENRLTVDLGPLNSWSTRLSWFPGPDWALQASTGRLTEPELPLAPGDIQRTTASATHVREYPWGWWSSSLVWGQNVELHHETTVLQSYGLESQLDRGPNHLYGRFELLDKAGLGLPGVDHHALSRVGALTLGASRDVDGSDAFDLALGADATAYSLDAATHAAYGFNPVSFRVYLRMRPPTMQHAGGARHD